MPVILLFDSCELLSKSYLWPIENSVYKFVSISAMLWIAFKILSLTDWKQLIKLRGAHLACCELLSKSYLWPIENSFTEMMLRLRHVVNCFQNLIFDRLKTAESRDLSRNSSCELLSKSYLWPIENSGRSGMLICSTVVNCFQNLIFDRLKTAIWSVELRSSRLWIAFKILSLTDWKQLCFVWRCKDNVVNCFQNLIFDRLKTAYTIRVRRPCVLWIAFKILSLTDWKQQEIVDFHITLSCELLSKSYLWPIENSKRGTMKKSN